MSWAGNDAYDRDGFRLNDPSGGAARAAPPPPSMAAGPPAMGAMMAGGFPPAMGPPMGAPTGMGAPPMGPPMQMQTIQVPQQMQTFAPAQMSQMVAPFQQMEPPVQMQTISVPQMAPRPLMQTVSVPQPQQYMTIRASIQPPQQTVRLLQQAPALAPPPQQVFSSPQFEVPPPVMNGAAAYNGVPAALTYSPGITLEAAPNGQIVIVDINPESSTWHSSLKIGDIVVQIDGAAARSVGEANNLLKGEQESVIAIETDENEVSVVRDIPSKGATAPPPLGGGSALPPGAPDERQFGDTFVQPGGVGSLMDQATCARLGLPYGTVWGPPTGRKTGGGYPPPPPEEEGRGTQV